MTMRYSVEHLRDTAGLAVVMSLVVATAAMAQSPTPEDKPHLRSVDATPSPSATVETADPKARGLTQKDKAFMKSAAKGNLMEVEMGRMAQSQAKSTEVRRIGGKIAADHTKANKELLALAAKKGVDLSKEKPKMDHPSKSDFDKEYLASMVKDHEQDIAEFESAAKDVPDADLKKYAEKTLPVLRNHLAMVKKAQEKTK